MPKQKKNLPEKPKKNNEDLLKLPLKPRQRIFIAEYLVDLDATRAAISAGYSAHSARFIGKDNLQKPHIKSEIDRQIEARKNRIGVTAEEVINELRLIGMANMSDFVVVNEDGSIQVTPLNKLSEGKSRIIKKVKEKRVIRTTKGTEDNPDGDQILDSTYEFELCDKVKSLELLSRHLGILHDKQEIDIKQPVQITVKKFCSRKNATKIAS